MKKIKNIKKVKAMCKKCGKYPISCKGLSPDSPFTGCIFKKPKGKIKKK